MDGHDHERIAAEVEEVVVRPHAIDAQNALPEIANRFLELRCRSVRWRRLCAGRRGRGQSRAVHLAIGREGERVQRYKQRRNHVVRKLSREELAQVRR